MIKSVKTIMRQDREPYRIPRRVQDVIPIQTIWADGIFRVGSKFSKTYRFTDCQRHLKMQFFAEMKCHFSPGSMRVYTALITVPLVGLKPVKS